MPQTLEELTPEQLITQLLGDALAIGRTGPWIHGEIPSKQGGINHSIHSASLGGGPICEYIANNKPPPNVTPEEINSIYNYIQRSFSAIPLLIKLIEERNTVIEEQRKEILDLQTKLVDCQKNVVAKPQIGPQGQSSINC